jgi:CobQ-like glutamine amidotransferase family enzyme
LPGAEPSHLFEVTRGAGLHPGGAGEGWRRGNFMATYLLGPLVVMNPDFGRRLLALMGVEEPHLIFEDQIEAAYRARLAEFEQPGRSFDY